MHAALASDVLAEHHHPRVHFELVLERAAHGGQQIDAGTLRFGPLGSPARCSGLGPYAALRLNLGCAVRVVLGKDVAAHARGVRGTHLLDARARIGHGRAGAFHQRVPLGCGHEPRHELGAKPLPRIALALRGDQRRPLVCLRILA